MVLASVLVGLFCGGCGDYFRPVANPVLQPGGDTQRTSHAVVISRDSGLNACSSSDVGAAINIDVSGDTNVATFTVGRNPIHFASLPGTLHAFIADKDDNNIASYTAASFTNPNQTFDAFRTTLSGSSPTFIATAGFRVFVAEPTLNQVEVIDGTTNALVPPAIPVGPNPVALVATPDGTKMYSLNQGNDSLTVIFTANKTTPTTIPLPAGSKPVWGVASADGTQVYIVNQGTNNVSVIDTSSDTIVNTFSVGTGPSYAVFQASQKRLYVVSPASTSLSIIDVTAGTVATQSLAAPSLCNAGNPISVTALAGGSRAYVADQATSTVCVLNATNNTFVKNIPVGSGPIGMASNSDSTRVYTANLGTKVGIASVSRAPDNLHNVNVATVTTASSNPFSVGEVVTIFGVSDCSFDGQFAIAQVISPTQFTFAFPAPLLPAVATSSLGGSASDANVSILETATDAPVMNTNVSPAIPLTIPVLGMPTYIAMTP